jgi:hypothetical protein
MEKKIDELIKDYKFYGDERVSCKTVLEHLEQLKAELKEQHNKDVVGAFRDGQKDGILTVNYSHKTKMPEQYYNQNH